MGYYVVRTSTIRRMCFVILTYAVGLIITMVLLLALNVETANITFDGNNTTCWFQIFLHNILIILLNIISGFVMSIPSLFLIFINGMSVGVVVGQCIASHKICELLCCLFPHAIPEVIALFIAGEMSLGISCGILKKQLKFSNLFFLKLTICLLLTIMSSLIEGKI